MWWEMQSNVAEFQNIIHAVFKKYFFWGVEDKLGPPFKIWNE
jgi:hypothetical protein